MNSTELGLYYIRHYYTTEEVESMKREYKTMNLEKYGASFPSYVAYCYERDNNPADPHCW